MMTSPVVDPSAALGAGVGRVAVPPAAEVRRLFEPAAREVPIPASEGALALDLWGDEEEQETEIPPVEPWAHRFSQAVVEAIGGVRPVSQLVRWTTRSVYRDLERRVRVLSEARHGGRVASLVRPQVVSVRVCHPSPGVAEVAVTVRHGQRTRALAARLEFRRDLWCCTALELG
jgi:hypothetical protein